MKNKNKQELLDIIQKSKDEWEKRKAKMYLYYLIEHLQDQELKQCMTQSNDEFEKYIAKWHLWRRHLDKSFDNLLNIIKKSNDEDRVREAAIIMGEEGYAEAIDILIDLLSNSDSPFIRDGAALGLRELVDQRALEPIVETIKAHPDNCSTLVYALETLDCHTILEFLVDIFISQPKDFMLRCSALECVKNVDMSTVSKETVEKCGKKINDAMKASSEEENIEQLAWLIEPLGKVKQKDEPNNK